MSTSEVLEKQARCLHSSRSKEVIMGQKTGDYVCNDCGEVLMPGEKIQAPEHRAGIIISVHALLIAMRANSNLKLVQNYKPAYRNPYDWALVDASESITIPVAASVVNEATTSGVIKI